MTKHISNFFLLINVNLYLYLIKYALGGINARKGSLDPSLYSVMFTHISSICGVCPTATMLENL